MARCSDAFVLRTERNFMSDILKVGDILTLDVYEINNLGAGVAKHDGLVVFVKGAVSGDVVRAKIIKLNKSFAVARLEEIVKASPYREDAESACREPNACGGCVWRGVAVPLLYMVAQES